MTSLTRFPQYRAIQQEVQNSWCMYLPSPTAIFSISPPETRLRLDPKFHTDKNQLDNLHSARISAILHQCRLLLLTKTWRSCLFLGRHFSVMLMRLAFSAIGCETLVRIAIFNVIIAGAIDYLSQLQLLETSWSVETKPHWNKLKIAPRSIGYPTKAIEKETEVSIALAGVS